MNQQDCILKIVSSFYDKARNDILIGYHFRNIEDFNTHIPRIASFWEIQLLGKTSHKIAPPFDVLNAHIPLHIKKGELHRWLLLFRITLKEEKKLFTEENDLFEKWEERLNHFEGIFLRFFGL